VERVGLALVVAEFVGEELEIRTASSRASGVVTV
jgi:hypothetical protein